jgi:hypothetical protein
MVHLICFNRAVQGALHRLGQGGMAQPPAPAVAGPAREAQLSGDTPGGPGTPQQKGREKPVRQWALALRQQGRGEVGEGALAMMAPVPFAPGSLLLGAPRAHGVALAARTWQGPILPAQCTEVRLALFGVAEVVPMGAHRHGGESPRVVKPVLSLGDSHMFMPFLRSYKRREIERILLALTG